jgi:hypothetical protein
MMFNATFNNISVILWQSVLLVEETRVPGENHRRGARHWQIMLYRVHLVVNGIMATQLLFSMASLLSFHILHRVEFIKSVIYGIVKQMILMIQTL